MASDIQGGSLVTLDDLRFQRRYVQTRLKELKTEREALVARKQSLDHQLAQHRARKVDSVATAQ